MEMCVEVEPTKKKGSFFSLLFDATISKHISHFFVVVVLHFNSVIEHLEDLQCLGGNEIIYVLKNKYESSKCIHRFRLLMKTFDTLL